MILYHKFSFLSIGFAKFNMGDFNEFRRLYLLEITYYAILFIEILQFVCFCVDNTKREDCKTAFPSVAEKKGLKLCRGLYSVTSCEIS